MKFAYCGKHFRSLFAFVLVARATIRLAHRVAPRARLHFLLREFFFVATCIFLPSRRADRESFVAVEMIFPLPHRQEASLSLSLFSMQRQSPAAPSQAIVVREMLNRDGSAPSPQTVRSIRASASENPSAVPSTFCALDTALFQRWSRLSNDASNESPVLNGSDETFDRLSMIDTQAVLVHAKWTKVLLDGYPATTPAVEGAHQLLAFEASKTKSRVCGKKLRRGDIAYHCLTCAADPTCILCSGCFEASPCRRHDYRTLHSGGGMCDCGDPTAWKAAGFCSHHRGAEASDDPLQALNAEDSLWMLQCTEIAVRLLVRLVDAATQPLAAATSLAASPEADDEPTPPAQRRWRGVGSAVRDVVRSAFGIAAEAPSSKTPDFVKASALMSYAANIAEQLAALAAISDAARRLISRALCSLFNYDSRFDRVSSLDSDASADSSCLAHLMRLELRILSGTDGAPTGTSDFRRDCIVRWAKIRSIGDVCAVDFFFRDAYVRAFAETIVDAVQCPEWKSENGLFGLAVQALTVPPAVEQALRPVVVVPGRRERTTLLHCMLAAMLRLQAFFPLHVTEAAIGRGAVAGPARAASGSTRAKPSDVAAMNAFLDAAANDVVLLLPRASPQAQLARTVLGRGRVNPEPTEETKSQFGRMRKKYSGFLRGLIYNLQHTMFATPSSSGAILCTRPLLRAFCLILRAVHQSSSVGAHEFDELLVHEEMWDFELTMSLLTNKLHKTLKRVLVSAARGGHGTNSATPPLLRSIAIEAMNGSMDLLVECINTVDLAAPDDTGPQADVFARLVQCAACSAPFPSLSSTMPTSVSDHDRHEMVTGDTIAAWPTDVVHEILSIVETLLPFRQRQLGKQGSVITLLVASRANDRPQLRLYPIQPFDPSPSGQGHAFSFNQPLLRLMALIVNAVSQSKIASPSLILRNFLLGSYPAFFRRIRDELLPFLMDQVLHQQTVVADMQQSTWSRYQQDLQSQLFYCQEFASMSTELDILLVQTLVCTFGPELPASHALVRFARSVGTTAAWGAKVEKRGGGHPGTHPMYVSLTAFMKFCLCVATDSTRTCDSDEETMQTRVIQELALGPKTRSQLTAAVLKLDTDSQHTAENEEQLARVLTKVANRDRRTSGDVMKLKIEYWQSVNPYYSHWLFSANQSHVRESFDVDVSSALRSGVIPMGPTLVGESPSQQQLRRAKQQHMLLSENAPAAADQHGPLFRSTLIASLHCVPTLSAAVSVIVAAGLWCADGPKRRHDDETFRKVLIDVPRPSIESLKVALDVITTAMKCIPTWLASRAGQPANIAACPFREALEIDWDAYEELHQRQRDSSTYTLVWNDPEGEMATQDPVEGAGNENAEGPLATASAGKSSNRRSKAKKKRHLPQSSTRQTAIDPAQHIKNLVQVLPAEGVAESRGLINVAMKAVQSTLRVYGQHQESLLVKLEGPAMMSALGALQYLVRAGDTSSAPSGPPPPGESQPPQLDTLDVGVLLQIQFILNSFSKSDAATSNAISDKPTGTCGSAPRVDDPQNSSIDPKARGDAEAEAAARKRRRVDLMQKQKMQFATNAAAFVSTDVSTTATPSSETFDPSGNASSSLHRSVTLFLAEVKCGFCLQSEHTRSDPLVLLGCQSPTRACDYIGLGIDRGGEHPSLPLQAFRVCGHVAHVSCTLKRIEYVRRCRETIERGHFDLTEAIQRHLYYKGFLFLQPPPVPELTAPTNISELFGELAKQQVLGSNGEVLCPMCSRVCNVMTLLPTGLAPPFSPEMAAHPAAAAAPQTSSGAIVRAAGSVLRMVATAIGPRTQAFRPGIASPQLPGEDAPQPQVQGDDDRSPLSRHITGLLAHAVDGVARRGGGVTATSRTQLIVNTFVSALSGIGQNGVIHVVMTSAKPSSGTAIRQFVGFLALADTLSRWLGMQCGVTSERVDVAVTQSNDSEPNQRFLQGIVAEVRSRMDRIMAGRDVDDNALLTAAAWLLIESRLIVAYPQILSDGEGDWPSLVKGTLNHFSRLAEATAREAVSTGCVQTAPVAAVHVLQGRMHLILRTLGYLKCVATGRLLPSMVQLLASVNDDFARLGDLVKFEEFAVPATMDRTQDVPFDDEAQEIAENLWLRNAVKISSDTTSGSSPTRGTSLLTVVRYLVSDGAETSSSATDDVQRWTSWAGVFPPTTQVTEPETVPQVAQTLVIARELCHSTLDTPGVGHADDAPYGLPFTTSTWLTAWFNVKGRIRRADYLFSATSTVAPRRESTPRDAVEGFEEAVRRVFADVFFVMNSYEETERLASTTTQCDVPQENSGTSENSSSDSEGQAAMQRQRQRQGGRRRRAPPALGTTEAALSSGDEAEERAAATQQVAAVSELATSAIRQQPRLVRQRPRRISLGPDPIGRTTRRCVECDTLPARAALCLHCGSIVCLQRQVDGVRDGELLLHAVHSCHRILPVPSDTATNDASLDLVSCVAVPFTGAMGAFLWLRNGALILINTTRGRAAQVDAPFIDRYGEIDRGLRRGRPLHLDAKERAVDVLLMLLLGTFDSDPAALNNAWRDRLETL